MKRLLAICSAMLFIFVLAGTAGATLGYQFEYNVYNGFLEDAPFHNGVAPSLPPAATSYGSVTITDNGNAVDLLFNLNDFDADGDPLDYGISRIYLNLNDDIFTTAGSTFLTPLASLSTGDNIGVQRDGPAADGHYDNVDNTLDPGGDPNYPDIGKFDILITPNSTTGSGSSFPDGFSTSLSLTGIDLDPMDFLFMDVHTGGTDPDFYSVIRTFWDDNSVNSSGTFWVGASSAAPVPEPATMLLLGSGLVGLAGFGRKKFFKK